MPNRREIYYTPTSGLFVDAWKIVKIYSPFREWETSFRDVVGEYRLRRFLSLRIKYYTQVLREFCPSLA
jgi:hypothetical protein